MERISVLDLFYGLQILMAKATTETRRWEILLIFHFRPQSS